MGLGLGTLEDSRWRTLGSSTLRTRSAATGVFKEQEAPEGIRGNKLQAFQVLRTCPYTWSSMSDRRGETTSVRHGLRWAYSSAGSW